jgi:Ca-activated chloride channel family protein
MRSLLSLAVSIALPLFAADGPIPTKAFTSIKTDIRINVNMTMVPVTVVDPIGRNVLGLDRDNFRVYDGSEARPIVSFGTDDAPLSIGLIFDCSGSMRDKFAMARQTPAELYKQLNPEDDSFLITVADRSEMLVPTTSVFEDIQNALMFVAPRGNTSLIDGVYLGLENLKHARHPRRALIVVSDGGDNYSRYTLRELSALAVEANTQIFSICLFQNPRTAEELNGPAFLEKLAQLTGGVSYFTTSTNDLRRAMSQTGSGLHNEYVLGYYPPQNVAPGKYRKIKVQVAVPVTAPKLQVFARTGYYAPESR